MSGTLPKTRRVVLHLRDGLREVVDAGDVFFLEAAGDNTRVRLLRKKARIDVRSLSEVIGDLPPGVFHRVHRSYVVNLNRVRFVRRRDGSDDEWELKLEPPVNMILPISRRAVRGFLEALKT